MSAGRLASALGLALALAGCDGAAASRATAVADPARSAGSAVAHTRPESSPSTPPRARATLHAPTPNAAACAGTPSCGAPVACEGLPEGAACDVPGWCPAQGTCEADRCRDVTPPPEPAYGVGFSDITESAGITWFSTAPASLPAGGGLVDLDGDGFDDVLLTTYSATGSVSRLGVFRARGDGTFEDVSAAFGLSGLQLAITGVAAGDIDNDGDRDLYLTSYTQNVLLRNDGVAGFRPVTLGWGADDPRWSTAAAFGDFDGDGFLDLYVGNYIAQSDYPHHEAQPNRLLRNRGDGTFEDVTEAAGVGGAGTTLAVAFADLDDDGDADLLVCNDHGAHVEANRVYRNDGAGPGGPVFTEVAAAWGLDVAIYCMGIAVGDVDGDGRLDVYVTNLGPNRLFRGADGGGFEEVPLLAAAQATDPCAAGAMVSSWGAGLHDFDLDGRLDLHVSNGGLLAAPELQNSFLVSSTLLLGAAGGLIDVGPWVGLGRPGALGRGSAYADVDRDGRMDLLQLHVEGSPVLYLNRSDPRGAWLGLRLRGWRSNRDGLGARVRAWAGGRLLVREAGAQGSYGSTSSPDVHLGLGQATDLERLDIRWPSGIAQRLLHLAPNRWLEVREPRLTFAGPATAEPGATGALALTLPIASHAPGPVTAHLHARARCGSTETALATTALAAVPPAGALRGLELPLPDPPPGSACTLLLTLDDGDGGLDEAALPLSALP